MATQTSEIPPSYHSRRSPVFGIKGCVATSQPIASEIGLRILQKGGNAADAAVAIAAVLNVTEPCSTGIGGDCFCLFYDASKRKVFGLNGSGRCPSLLSISRLMNEEFSGMSLESLPPLSVHCVTIPGAASGWCDIVERFGRMSIGQLLSPAIELAETGFPVSPITAYSWEKGALHTLNNKSNAQEMLLNGRAPKAGEVIRLPYLAETFREISNYGKQGFYQGRIARSIVEVVQNSGGHMTLEDLQNHTSSIDNPIHVNYRGIDIWEMPPNGQGITALMALNILEGFDISSLKHNSAEYLHLLIESLRLAFADTRWYVADPLYSSVPMEEMLSKNYAAKRRSLIETNRASVDVQKGSPTSMSNTVYFCVVDADGNACSFINSNYMGFGTGLVPKGCGFTLQNRGANFSLIPGHPNALSGGKRPYHTIIPAMATYKEGLWAPLGVMGGFMQPQGHVQVLLNMIDHNMEPQTALDCSRFVIMDGTSNGKVFFEEGISNDTIKTLDSMGHNVSKEVLVGFDRSHFGRGQIIRRYAENSVLWAGSDPRADGLALGWC